MLRKIAAGTSAAVVAAGLAAAPAAATELSGPPADSCTDVGAGQTGPDPLAPGFVFGPLADVPHLMATDRSCVTVTPAVADFSSVRRKSSAPPPVGNPAPEEPSSPPPDEPGPGGPGPGDSVPRSTVPPLETAGPPAAPEFTPVTGPEAVPTPTPAPAEPRRPNEAVLPRAETPRLPQTAADTRPLTVAGGGSLVAAGLAWIGGARRRRKRPHGPSPAG
jgi:LPXTG-motif cell wall-anchored protein